MPKQTLWNSAKLEDFEDWTPADMPYTLGYGRQADQWVLVKTIESSKQALLLEEFKWLELQDGPAYPKPLLWQSGNDVAQAIYLISEARPLARLITEKNRELKTILEWGLQIADSLIELHRQGTLLLACSPANCLVRSDGNGAFFWDWSQAYDRKQKTFHLAAREAAFPFHHLFLAPELIGTQLRPPELSSDVFGLAASLVYSLIGPPSQGRPARDDLPALLVQLEQRQGSWPRILPRLLAQGTEKQVQRRFRTVWGFRSDLRELYSELHSRVGDLSWDLGQRDIVDHPLIEQLAIYGRDLELAALDVAFNKFMQGESIGAIIIGGAGVGKSALLSHFMQQHKPDACLMTQVSLQAGSLSRPFAPLIGALENLVQQLLLKSQRDLLVWRKKILDAVGENSALMIELIPDLAIVLDHQGKVPQLPPREEAIRFAFTLRNFLGAFCQKDHPLFLFIADGQWLDKDTVDLLHSFFDRGKLEHIFLAVSYLPDAHQAPCSLERITDLLASGFTQHFALTLHPLHTDSIARYLSDVLSCEQERTEDLAVTIYQKTKGVPALIKSMLQGLWDQKSLAFDYRSFHFFWNLSEAQAWKIDEGLIQSLLKELLGLAPQALEVLEAASCFLRDFTPTDLAGLLKIDLKVLDAHLRAVVAEGLLLALHSESGTTSFRFVHEEIRSEVYRRMTLQARRAWHRAIAAQAQGKGDEPFWIEQSNLALDPELSTFDLALAELNLKLARRSRRAASLQQAQRYLGYAQQYLGPRPWDDHYRLTLTIHEEIATIANLEQNQELLQATVDRALIHVTDAHDNLVLLEMQIAATLKIDQNKALAMALPILQQAGLSFPRNPSRLRTHLEVWIAHLRSGRDATKKVSAPEVLSTVALRLAIRLATGAEGVESRIATILWAQALRLSVTLGSLPTLPLVYAHFARLLIERYGRFRAAIRLVEHAEAVAKSYDDKRIAGFLSAFIYPWYKALDPCLVHLLRSFRLGLESGEYGAAAQSMIFYGHYSFAAGCKVNRLLDDLNAYRPLIEDLRHRESSQHIDLLRQLLLRLSSDASPLDPNWIKQHASRSLKFYFHLNQLVLQVFRHQLTELDEISGDVLEEGAYSRSCYTFYRALRSVRLHEAGRLPLKQTIKELKRARAQFKVWSRFKSQHALHRLLLIEAEIARWQGHTLKALRFYTQAIEAAEATRHEKALVLEQLARLFYILGFHLLARDYLKQALDTYREWEAHSLVAHLREIYLAWDLGSALDSQLPVQRNAYGLEYLQQSLSEITRETDSKVLIEKILQTAVHITQAERGHFMIKSYEEKIFKVKQSYEEGVSSYPDIHFFQMGDLCLSVINYVLRTNRATVIDDAQIPQRAVPGLERDPYVLDKVVRSLACLPIEISNAGERELVAMIYLENNSYSHTFSPDRIQFLALIAQAAAGRLEIAEKAQSLEESLKQAELVQRALLPSIKELNGFSISDYFRPAEHTGGDWYGYCEDEVRQWAFFFIGDVTGHGVSSALITGTAAGAAYSAIATLQALARKLDLSETLKIVAQAVNKAVFTTAARVDKMMTMAFIAFDARSGEVAFINAAHPHGFIVSDNKVQPIMGRGSPLGYTRDPDYQIQTFRLKAGDFLFFYSDGLMENEGPAGERLHSRALVKILESSREPESIKRDLLERTQLIWQNARADDDYAFVIIRWDGDPGDIKLAAQDRAG